MSVTPDPTGLDRDCQFTSFLTVSGRALFLRESICAVKQACESSLVGGALWRRRAQPEMALPRRGRQGSQGGAITRGWPGARRRRWRMAGASGRSRRSARSPRKSGFRNRARRRPGLRHAAPRWQPGRVDAPACASITTPAAARRRVGGRGRAGARSSRSMSPSAPRWRFARRARSE